MGFVGDAIGGVGDVLGDTIGQVPVVGDVVKAGLPILGGAIGGPVGGALGGALSKGMAGGASPEEILQAGAGGFGLQQGMEGFRQAQQDRDRSRELTNQAISQSQRANDLAMGLWNRGQPQRDAFRRGAMNFSDPTNPFANPVSMAPSFPGGVTPQAPAPRRPSPEPQFTGPEPGSFAKRIDDALSGAMTNNRVDSRGVRPVSRPTPQDPASTRGGRSRLGGLGRGGGRGGFQGAINDEMSRIQEAVSKLRGGFEEAGGPDGGPIPIGGGNDQNKRDLGNDVMTPPGGPFVLGGSRRGR